MLKNNEHVLIHAALEKDKILYEIKNNPISVIIKNSYINDSGQYIMDYNDSINQIRMIERHKIKLLKNYKYKIEDFRECD